VWAKLVLLKLGFDATADDANAWLPPMRSERDADDITEQDLAAARQELTAQAPGKRFLWKGDVLASQVEILFLTPAGQQAIRDAIRDRKVSREIVAKIFDE